MRLNDFIVAASFMTLLVSFWNRNDIPGNVVLHPDTGGEPRQTVTREPAFTARYGGVEYRVEPEYEYELVGMVVSFRQHDGSSRMHRQAGDHLNMIDVCVVWGENATHPELNELDFWNGIFTCNVQTRNQAAWDRFDMYDLSNNHLISDDDAIRDRVTGLKVGDQVRIRGWLASYTGPGGIRGTSTTRDDTGDGACETIWVRAFDIVEPARSNWRRAMYASLLLLAGSLVVHFRRPYRPHANGR